MTAPLIHMAGDTPRARRSDPEASHIAADVSGRTWSRMKEVVFTIFATVEVYGVGLTDSELDEYYARWGSVMGWPSCRYETPRKRRSDLTREGVLEDSGILRPNRFKGLETVWVISPDGRRLLQELGR